jgi:predicted permease
MKPFRKLGALFRRRKLDVEMAEELRGHIELQTERNLAAGLSPEEARYAARRQFGGVEQIKELARAQRSGVWLEQTWQDLCYAVHALRRTPVFSLTAVLTLVLGLGATVTVFTLVDAVVWRPLPYAEPDRLVEAFSLTRQALRDWTEAQQVAERVEPHQQRSMVLSGDFEAAQVGAEAVSPGLFDLLGRAPALGRAFAPADAEEGSPPVVILGDGFWRRRFGGDPGVVGRRITLDEKIYTVIGVMPRGFGFRGPRAELWVPLPRATTDAALRQGVDVIARLRPGLGFPAAREAVKTLNRQLDQTHPQARAWGVALVLLDQARVNPGPRRMMLLTFGAVVFVLLIACANVANLLLVRATVRQREFAVRAALGAGGGRLIRQVLTESLLLVALGAAGGLAVAHWTVQAIWKLAPQELTFLTVNEVTIDWRVWAFTVATVGLAMLVCGLVPALRAARFDAGQVLNSATRTAVATRRQRGWQQGFVVVQTALAFVLLVSAGLLLRGFVRLSSVPPGFEMHNLAALSLQLPSARYPSVAARQEFFDQLRARVAALPGVSGATVALGVPPRMGLLSFGVEVEMEGRALEKMPPSEVLPSNSVGDDYFRLLRIPLLRGRLFDAQDVSGGPTAIVINDRMARRFWSDADPIGQRIRFGPTQPWLTVVGVVGDVKAMDLSDESGSLEYYRSLRQEPYRGYMTLAIRTEMDPSRMGPAIRGQVAALDPRLPIASYASVEAQMAETLAIRRFCLGLMGGFAGVAILLATVGLYGVMSYTVAQRIPEIGVRIALGGGTWDIVGLVTGRGLRLTGLGLAIGIALAAGLTRFLTTLLFEITPLDPATFLGVAAILGLVGVLACWLPARRAARIDPVVALRTE